MNPVGWWVLSIALIVAGVVGTFLPVLPGVLLVFGGMLLGAWIDDFQRVGWITLVILGGLTVLVFVVDFLSSFLGARRVGASGLALAGATIGTVVGFFFGFVGIFVAPFIGAFIGELIARGRVAPAARVGVGTWIGLVAGALAKLALVLAMVGVFVTSYLIS